MPSTLNQGNISATDPRAGRQQGARSLWFMIFVVIGIPLMACFLSFPITESHWFRRHADPRWVQSSSQIYTAHDVSCDVVVYGDSTVITGIDPVELQKLTGMRSCNIGQTKAAMVVLGTSGLDFFLKHNPRPRYLIIQLSGANFYRSYNWSETGAYMEGVVPLLRYYSSREFFADLFHHPEIFMGMMHYAYITGPLNLWKGGPMPSLVSTDGSPLNVHFIMTAPAIHNCAEAVDLDATFHEPDSDFIRNLWKKYSGAADHLVVDAAPLSVCDGRFGVIEQHLQGISNTLEQFPMDLYNEGYAHYTSQGASRLSREVAEQINAIKAQAGRDKTGELSGGGD